jgi:hypothetical protein
VQQKLNLKEWWPVLIVGLDDAKKTKANNKSFNKQGDFLSVQPSEKIKLMNDSEQEFSFAILD